MKTQRVIEDLPKPAIGRPPMPEGMAQDAMIRARVTEAQRAEYERRGGKAWLIRELGRKPRT